MHNSIQIFDNINEIIKIIRNLNEILIAYGTYIGKTSAMTQWHIYNLSTNQFIQNNSNIFYVIVYIVFRVEYAWYSRE